MRRSRTYVLVLLTVLAMLGAAAPVGADSWIRVYLNEHQLYLAEAPVLIDDRVLVPMRGFVESLGGAIHWEAPGRITADLQEHSVIMEIGNRAASVSGRTVDLDLPPRLIGNRTYIQLRFLSEGLGTTVHYDGAVHVYTPRAPRLVVFDGPLNVRTLPTTGSAILTTVPAGTRFEVVGTSDSWTQVRLPEGKSGWVAAEFTHNIAPLPAMEMVSEALQGPQGYLEIQGECLGRTPLIDGRIHVPLRPALQSLGGEAVWDAGVTTIRYRGQEIQLKPGVPLAETGTGVRRIAPAPIALSNDLFVPARALADLLDLHLQWDTGRSAVTLTAPGTLLPWREVCNPRIGVSAYLIVEADTGLVLAEQNAGDTRLIASTAKIMTALLALEHGNLSSQVTVSAKAAATIGTSMELWAGQRLPLSELLYGLVLRSGNDAAVAVAEHIAGSEAAFARLMTLRARELGATDTTFVNASGLDDWDRGYSNAADLGLIAQAAMARPDFRALVGVTEHWSSPGKLSNRNDFVWVYPGATGVKNGWTELAGHTLVASAYRGGAEVIVVLLDAPTRDGLYQTASQLMDHGFSLRQQAWVLQAAGGTGG